MNSRQKNFTLWSRTNDIVGTVNKYNLSPKLKKEKDVLQFIMDETTHFPKNRSLPFRAKAVAMENSCECKYCYSIVKEWGNQFCSHKCYTSYKKENPTYESLDEILARVPSLILYKPDDFPTGTATPDDEDQFVSAWNKIKGLDVSFLESIGACTDYPNNTKNHMLAYLSRVATWNKSSIRDYFSHVIECVEHPEKTENLDWFTLLYGEEYAKEKLKKKSERVSGDKNPGYQHDGRLSPFSEKFVGGDIRTETFKKAMDSREESNGNTTRLSYWTERYGEEEGKRLYYDRQNTFSKEKLIASYGEEEGLRRWNERQEKWQSTLKNLPEEEKIRINAKKGFWRYSRPTTDDMNPDDPFNKMETKLYVIVYQPRGYEKSFIKVGVTSKYLTDRFPAMTIKEEILIHKADRFTNYQIESDIKKFIFNNDMSILIESEDKKFDGWTECVDHQNKDRIMSIVYEAIRTNQQEI